MNDNESSEATLEAAAPMGAMPWIDLIRTRMGDIRPENPERTGVKTSVLAYRPVVEAYVNNMERLIAMYGLPQEIVWWAAIEGNCAGNAPITIGLGRNAVFASGDPAIISHYLAAKSRYGEESYDVDPNLAFQISSAFLVDLYSKGYRHINDGVDAFAYALALNAYASFEAFSGDLWIEAVNADFKAAAAVLAGTFRPKGKTNQQDQDDEDDGNLEARTISLGDLAKNRFDLSRKMGTLLKNKKIVGFGSLPRIQSAWLYAFGADGEKPFLNAPKLPLLAKTRHLIAHRSGKIDKEYADFAKSWPEFGCGAEGEYVNLNQTVNELIFASVQAAVDLLQFVEESMGNVVEAVPYPSAAPEA